MAPVKSMADALGQAATQVGQTEKTLASLKDYTAPNVARIRVILEASRHGKQDMEEIKRALLGELEGLSGAVWTFRDEGIGLGDDVIDVGIGVNIVQPHPGTQLSQLASHGDEAGLNIAPAVFAGGVLDVEAISGGVLADDQQFLDARLYQPLGLVQH